MGEEYWVTILHVSFVLHSFHDLYDFITRES